MFRATNQSSNITFFQISGKKKNIVIIESFLSFTPMGE